MLLLTSFILTCIATVLFLLQTSFVLQSDANPATGRDERTPAVRRRMRGHRGFHALPGSLQFHTPSGGVALHFP